MWSIWKEMAEFPITRMYMLMAYIEGALTVLIIGILVLTFR